MEIYNEKMERMDKPDLSRGYLRPDVRIVRHDAVQGVPEQGHYEVAAEYENGGKDVEWVVDVPGVRAQEAWEEEIPIRIYVPYTQEELDAVEEQKNRPTLEERIAALEEASRRMRELMGSVLSGMTEYREVK